MTPRERSSSRRACAGCSGAGLPSACARQAAATGTSLLATRHDTVMHVDLLRQLAAVPADPVRRHGDRVGEVELPEPFHRLVPQQQHVAVVGRAAQHGHQAGTDPSPVVRANRRPTVPERGCFAATVSSGRSRAVQGADADRVVLLVAEVGFRDAVRVRQDSSVVDRCRVPPSRSFGSNLRRACWGVSAEPGQHCNRARRSSPSAPPTSGASPRGRPCTPGGAAGLCTADGVDQWPQLVVRAEASRPVRPGRMSSRCRDEGPRASNAAPRPGKAARGRATGRRSAR